jgi:hypothetical protein
LKELRTLLFQRALYNYHAVMYFKKEIIISFFIITISASDLYMPMIWLYLFLLDFLIPFLCGPDLQCVEAHPDAMDAQWSCGGSPWSIGILGPWRLLLGHRGSSSGRGGSSWSLGDSSLGLGGSFWGHRGTSWGRGGSPWSLASSP